MKMKRVILVMLLLFGFVFAYQVLPTQRNLPEDWGRGKGSINLNETLGPLVPVENTSQLILLDRPVYSPEDTLVLTIINRGNSTLITGYDFRLYHKGREGWIEVQLNLAFPKVVIEIEPSGSWDQKVDLSTLGLKPGTYKIEKRICSDNVCFYEGVEFEVIR